jgi:ribosomal protein S18 acetylase RimI-like enzyme
MARRVKKTQATTPLPCQIRLAQAEDISAIEWLDTFGTSPHRDINRHVEQYFGSVDPSIHERNLIFLAELRPDLISDLPYRAIGKAEMLLSPSDHPSDIGYVKRVVVHPDWRGAHIARYLLTHIASLALEYQVAHLDLHVWEGNTSAIRLYDSLGFQLMHRELYLRLEVNKEDSGQRE